MPDFRYVESFVRGHWLWLGGGILALGTAPAAPSPAPAASTMVGRGNELARLAGWFDEARSGSRRIVFVAGKAGIGKSTLTRAFVEMLAAPTYASPWPGGGIVIGRGQCVEQYGAGEPYMPILEALTRMCREPGGAQLVAILHRMAPAWLVQMPSLISEEDRVRLQGLAQGTTQQRMLREMAEAFEVIATEHPLILFLEDLHWSDPSTLDLIATVARRTESARLMILGTYRPVEMLAETNPLRAMKEELELHNQCIELRLALLNEAEVATYVAQRISDRADSIAPAVYARSEGNPLFMVNVTDYLVEQGSTIDADKIEAPRNIRQMIERNLQRLSPDEQRVLAAASVAGVEFSTATLAAALQCRQAEADICCSRLARNQQFINPAGIEQWPDGTVAQRLRFQHALYQETVLNGLATSQTAELHGRIAQRLESGFRGRSDEIAAELAHHYSRSQQAEKAAQYFTRAALVALQRSAFTEAESHLRNGLSLLDAVTDKATHDSLELKLTSLLAQVLGPTKGYGASETRKLASHAQVLAEKNGTLGEFGLQLYSVYQGLVAGDYPNALRVADELLALAKREGGATSAALAHHAELQCRYFLGDLEGMERHFCALADFVEDPGYQAVPGALVIGIATSGIGAYPAGYPDRARRRVAQAAALAQQAGNSFDRVFAFFAAMMLSRMQDEPEQVHGLAEAGSYLARACGFEMFEGFVRVLEGWAQAELTRTGESIPLIRAGIGDLKRIGSNVGITDALTSLAESQILGGKLDDALITLEEALTGYPQEVVYQPNILRCRGEVRAQLGDAVSAEGDLRDAIARGRRFQTKSFELRATTSLGRLLASQGKGEEARAMLAEIYGWFTEGFDTKDLIEAKALLDELGCEAN